MILDALPTEAFKNIADVLSAVRVPEHSLTRIKREVAAKHSLSAEELTGSDKNQRLFWARAEVAYRARRETKLSYPQIGRGLGRHHTTIIAAERRYIAEMVEACA